MFMEVVFLACIYGIVLKQLNRKTFGTLNWSHV
jgi:hypothetical protein